jgi:putative chitinase
MTDFTFEFTESKLQEIINNPAVKDWFNALNQFLPAYDINTRERVSAFIAQCSHESANFKVLKENLNYRAASLRKVFPKYFPTDEMANQFANKKEQIANKVYANRMGNGPEESGDGFRYHGRGLIQLTGKNNYQAFAKYVNKSIEEVVPYLETIDGAVESACWFWKTNNLNKWADTGDFVTLTKRINGGTIGLEDRQKHYNHAIEVFA